MTRKKSYSPKQRREAWEAAGGVDGKLATCFSCGLPIDYVKDGGWHMGHVDLPEVLGGKKVAPQHIACNMEDAWGKVIPMVAKSDRIWMKQHGQKKPKGRPVPGSKRSGLKKCVNGTVIDRRTGKVIKLGGSRQ